MKDLLFQLIQYPFDRKDKDVLKHLLHGVEDWNKAVDLINAHGIIALAAYNIKEAGLEKEIPVEAMAALENGYRQSVVRNLWLKERWKEVNEILSAAGIKHILLKGLALEHTLYGAKGLRQMTDNDILVRREEALKAWHLLQKSGFQAKTIKSGLHKNILLEIGKHLPTLFKDGYAVEIHTRLSDNELPDDNFYKRIFEEAHEIAIDDKKAYILPSETQLNYLIQHFDKHAFEGECQLRLYADILLLNKNKTFDFPDQFILNPSQSSNPSFRIAAYKSGVLSVPKKYRLRFLTGDIFPSLKWLKERYGCSGMRAWMYYPVRVGKLWWLV
jgi:hypothetical protein